MRRIPQRRFPRVVLTAALALCCGSGALAEETSAPKEEPGAEQGSKASSEGPKHVEHVEGTVCEREEPCEEGMVCTGLVCAPVGSLYWRDTDDAGDDPLEPGCHWEHTKNDCSDQGTFFGADVCLTSDKISEYTDSTCHIGSPIDLKTHDCPQVCRAAGFATGWCRRVANACGAGNASAKCHCWSPPPIP